MPRKMAAQILKSEPNFEQNMHSVLGLKPEIVSYWTAKCGGLVLDSTNLCERSNGDFIVKLGPSPKGGGLFSFVLVLLLQYILWKHILWKQFSPQYIYVTKGGAVTFACKSS